MDITATREAMGLTRTQLAEKLGVAPSTIYRLESGEISLTQRMEASIKMLCENMGVKP
jgi:transcriptional regulator with XRE-family HTH domain